MTSADALVQAAIAAGSAGLGGLVAGGLALRAGRKQWERDLLSARADRSREAASRMLTAIGQGEGAVAEWMAAPTEDHLETLRTRTNDLYLAVTAEIAHLSDPAVADRVRDHAGVMSTLAAVAKRSADPPLRVAGGVSRHADAVIEALQAHIAGEPLPAYHAPDWRSVAAVIAWQP